MIKVDFLLIKCMFLSEKEQDAIKPHLSQLMLLYVIPYIMHLCDNGKQKTTTVLTAVTLKNVRSKSRI